MPKKFITLEIISWVQISNLQSGIYAQKSKVEQFAERRPSINLNDLPSINLDAFVVHELKDRCSRINNISGTKLDNN